MAEDRWWEEAPLASAPKAPQEDRWWEEAPRAQSGEWQDWWENSNLKSGIYDRAVAAANLPHALISQNVQEAKNLYGLATGERSAAEAWEASPTVKNVQSALSPLTEFGSGGDPVEEAANLAMIGTPLRPGAPAAPTLLPRTRAGTPAPTAERLLEAGGEEGIKVARHMGVDYDPVVVSDMARRFQTDLIENAINKDVAPTVFKQLEKLSNPPVAGPGERVLVQFSDLETVKNVLQDARLKFKKPKQRMVAERLIGELDEFLEGRVPEGVLAGPAAAAGKVYEEAKANYAAGKRSERLTGTAAERAEKEPGLLESAELRADITGNLDRAIRSRVEQYLKNPQDRAGHSDAEIAQLEKVLKGRKFLTGAAKTLGGSNKIVQALMATTGAGLGTGAGYLVGGPWGAGAGSMIGTLGVPAVGAAAQAAASRATKKALEAVAQQVRKRSPLYEELLKSPVVKQVTDPSKRAAMVKALLLAAQEAQAAERASHTYGPGGNTL